MDSMLQEAIRLRKLGFAIHWLHPGEKVPIESAWSQNPVMSEAQLRATYQSGYNMGFRPGRWSVVDGKEVCVLDVDIRGGSAYAEEAYAAAKTMLNGSEFDVISGSVIGRHKYLLFPIGKSPNCAATTLRQSDVWVNRETFEVCAAEADNARPAWVIEILSTGKNVVMPPSIHPDTGKPYQFI